MTKRTASGKSASKRGDSKKGKSAKSKTPRASLQDELERAADGLGHTSESFYPFHFFTLPAEKDAELTPQGFLNCLGLSEMFIEDINVPVEKFIEVTPLEGF